MDVQTHIQPTTLCFKRWTRNGWSVLLTLQHHVVIGHLAACICDRLLQKTLSSLQNGLQPYTTHPTHKEESELLPEADPEQVILLLVLCKYIAFLLQTTRIEDQQKNTEVRHLHNGTYFYSFFHALPRRFRHPQKPSINKLPFCCIVKGSNRSYRVHFQKQYYILLFYYQQNASYYGSSRANINR